MTKPTTRELVRMAQQAGYQVFEAEQLRPNRWQLIVIDGVEKRWALLVQARPLLSSADVQDLADTVRLRRLDGGILLAHGGAFSPAAQRTHQELADGRLRLCTALPLAAKADHAESKAVRARLKPIP
jgi:hypothetical protein